METPPSSPSAPQPAASTAVQPSTPAASGYVSNPVALIMPSWNAIKLNLSAWVLSVIVPVGIFILAALVLGIQTGIHPAGFGVAIGIDVIAGLAVIVALVYLFAPVATMIMLDSVRGKKVTFGEVYKQSAPYRGKMVMLALLTGLAVLGGLILLVVPGLIFATWFSLGAYALIEENLDPVDAMKRSKELVGGHFAESAAVAFFGSAVGVLNVIPIIGFVATIVIGIMYSAAPALRYEQLKALKAGNHPAPPVHWANYAVLVLAIIGSVVGRSYSYKAPSAPSTNTTNYLQ